MMPTPAPPSFKTPWTARRGAALLLGAALLTPAGCDEDAAPALAAGGPVMVYHDFSVIDLGRSVTTDLEIPIPGNDYGDTVVSDSFHGDCSCAVGMVMIQPKVGTSRPVWGLPEDQRILRPDDRVILRLTLETEDKEPVDVPRTLSHGRIGFQLRSGIQARYEGVVVQFHYGIRSPIKVSPVAHVDFGELPLSRNFHQTLELTNNIPGQKLAFGPAHASPRSISVRAETEGEKTVLHITITPDPNAPRAVRGVIAIGTGLDFYTDLKIPVSGTFVGDIQYVPAESIGFDIFDFTKPKERDVILVDHDMRRAPGFVVHSFVSQTGEDISAHFDVRFQPLQGRRTRVLIKYLGTMGGIRLHGELRLAKSEGAEPIARLKLFGFRSPK